jgi:phosphoribosylglycinamide formyltransferase-1
MSTPAPSPEPRNRIVVLASGRGSNFQALIDGVADGHIKASIVRLITDNPAAYAIDRARNAGIPVSVLDYPVFPDRQAYERALFREIQDAGADLVVLAGYMRLLGEQIVGAFSDRMINIHPALLPCFPGLHAQRQALEYGVKVAGCTVHFVTLEMDSGPIIIQRCVRVEEDDDEQTLSERILREEHMCLVEAVALFCDGRLEVSGRRVCSR